MLHFCPNASHSQTDRSLNNTIWHCSKRVSFIYSIKSLSASPSALSISSTSKVNNALSCWSFSCASVRSLMMFSTSYKHSQRSKQRLTKSSLNPFQVMPYSSSFGEAHSITFRRIRTFQINILSAVDLALGLIIQPLAQQSRMCVISSSYKSVLVKHLY